MFSAVFQAGGLIVVLVEVARKAYLASIVPVIVNTILHEHQIVVDIVAFVNKGDFPRSRLREKQRGKILATWVTRKMRTMAQFGIRDPDSGLLDIDAPDRRSTGGGGIRGSGSMITSSLRNIEPAPQIIEQQEWEEQQQSNDHAPLPTGISEMPAISYDEASIRSPTSDVDGSRGIQDMSSSNTFELPGNDDMLSNSAANDRLNTFASSVNFDTPTFVTAIEPPDFPPPNVGAKPEQHQIAQQNFPAAESREGDLWSLPSQRQASGNGPNGGGGGLRVQNRSGVDGDDDWPAEAIMHMNLAGNAH